MMKPSNLLGFYFAFIPVFLLSDAGGVLPEISRETNLFLIGTVAVALLLLQWTRGRVSLQGSDPLGVPVLLLLVSLGLPVLSAAYLWDALRGWTLVLVGALVYLSVARSGMASQDTRPLLKIITACACAVLLYALFRHFRRPTPAQFLDFVDESLLTEEMQRQMLFAVLLGRAKALFGNPNHLAAFSNLLAAAPLAVLLAGRGIRWRLFAAACVVAQVWLLYLTKSRAGMLSFAGAFAIALVVWFRMRRGEGARYPKRAVAVGAVVLAVCTIGFMLFGGVRYLRPLLHTETLQTRLVWWAAATDLAASSPLRGYGLRMFALHFPNLREIGAPESQFIHNLYLETAVAGGALGLMALIWMQLNAYRAAWRMAAARRNVAGPALLAAVFGISVFWIHAGFDFVQEQSEIVVLFFFYLGLLACVAVGRRSSTGRRAGKAGLAAGVLLLVSIWIFLLMIPWQGMVHLALGREALEQKPPRFAESNRELATAGRWIPLSSKPHYLMGCNQLYTGGGPENGIRSLREAIRREPGMPHYHSTLAQMLWVVGRRQEALEEVGSAIRLHPAKPDYYFQRSRYREAIGDQSGALEDLRKAEEREKAEQVWMPDLEKLLGET